MPELRDGPDFVGEIWAFNEISRNAASSNAAEPRQNLITSRPTPVFHGSMSSSQLITADCPEVAVTTSREGMPGIEMGSRITVPSVPEVACTVCCRSKGAGGHAPWAGHGGVHPFRVS
jgi:hypothetical protein